MRKFLSMLLTLVMVLSMTATVAAEETKSDDIVILYTNDVHTYIDKEISYDDIAALKADLETQYNNVILVDAGDHAQGTAYGSMDKGATIIKLMNAAGYDLATLGNHEFDYGMTGCQNIVSWADYTYVSCNFYNEAAGVRGTNVLDSYKIFDCGKKVAFVGITTPESFTKSTPAYFQDGNGNYIYGIAGGTDGADLYADVQTAVDAAKAEGADIVIALGHLGDDPASKPWTSEETIANVSGLDAFIDGHSHSTVAGKNVTDEAGKAVLLTQTGEYFDAIGKMVIDAETGAITTELLSVDAVSGLTPDAEVKAIKDVWMTEIDTQLGTVIGSTSLTFDNYDANGGRLVRKQETNTGDFCADALYYLFDNMDMDVDVAIMNGGGVRNKAITGDISYKVCKEIHTFGNVACLQTITGQQLLDALEWGAKDVGTAENGGFLHVSGITYKIDSTIASTVQKDDKGVWTGAPTGEYRVHDVKVFNKATNAWEDLNLSAKYNLAGYNYTLRDLGDGFAMFDGAVNVLDYVSEDYMVLANYVKGFEGGVVGATNSPLKAKYSNLLVDYGTVNGSGRIVFGQATEDETPDVDSPSVDNGNGGAQSPTPDEIVTPGYVPSTPVVGESEHTLPSGEEVRMITTSDDSEVYVIGHPDLVPTGAEFASEQQTSGAIYDAAAAVVKNKIGNNVPFVVYEMDLTDAAGQAINQLKGYINVTLPIPADMELAANETIRVYRVENGKLYKCDTAVANGQVTFATNHFSTYILVKQNIALSPKTGDVSMMPVVAMILAMGAAVVVFNKKRAF